LFLAPFGQHVVVELETVQIVKGLPSLVAGDTGGYEASSSGGELIAAEDEP